MALGIPLPAEAGVGLLQGLNTGSTMFSRMMQPVLERERQKQLEQHFQQQMAQRQQEQAHAGQFDALKRMMMEQQLQGLRNANDPMYKINQFQNMAQMFGGGDMAQQEAPPQQMASEGMGMYSPEGLEQAQAQAMPTQQQGGSPGMNLDMLRNNPMLRGFFKQQFGYDPLTSGAQSPQDKQEMQLDLFRKKEDIKKQAKGGDSPTNAVLTQSQQAIQGIDTVLPMLDDMIKDSSKIYGRGDFSPSKKAAYNAKTSGMIDTLVAAQSLPKVQASIDLVEQQIRRATNESDDAYIERLKDLRKDLEARRKRAHSLITSRKVNTDELLVAPTSDKKVLKYNIETGRLE